MNFIFYLFSLCLWRYSSAAHGKTYTNETLPRILTALMGIELPFRPLPESNNDVKDKWFVQKLDHFNSTADTRTWKQRYQMYSGFYKTGGPVFLMIGGNAPIANWWMTNGAVAEYAKICNAALFQLEHRYYGESHPTEDVSSKNLVYLNTKQALADVEAFIKSNDKDKLRNAKWVVFGRSYAGSLAAWARLMYPNLVHAAVSSSGLVKAKVDYQEYFTVAKNAISSYNSKCASNIRRATMSISDFLQNDQSAKYITNKIKTCDRLNIKKNKDIEQLFQQLAFTVTETIQFNIDNKFKELKKLMTLKELCDVMLDKSLGNVLDRYLAVQEQLRSINGESCINNSYEPLVSVYKEKQWDRQIVKLGGKQWLYQTCTEIGDLIISNNKHLLFGTTLPLSYPIDFCRDVFKKSFDLDALKKAVKHTNDIYNDLRLNTSRVIYLHGSVDPWIELDLTRPKAFNSTSILIRGVSHCADIYPSSDSDPPQLSNARKTVLYNLQSWL